MKGEITISKVTCGQGDDYISIKIEDVNSGIAFCKVKMSLENFAKVITGLGLMDCDIEVMGLQNVGKQIERDKIKFPLPEDTFFGPSRKPIAIEEAKKHTPEGWTASEYYGSQDSFFQRDGKAWARTTIIRWVEVGSK